MSELANKLRELRGERTLRDIARSTKVAMRTAWRAEHGVFIKIETLEHLLSGQFVPRSEWAQYIIAWIKDAVGPENWSALEIKPARGSVPKNPVLEKIKQRAADLSHEDQRHLLSILTDENVLAAILPIAAIAGDAVAHRDKSK